MDNDDRPRASADGSGIPESANGTGPDEEPPVRIAERFAKADPELTFEPGSIPRLDDISEEVPPEKRQEFGSDLGAYLGETFVRSYDGEWLNYDAIGWVVAVPTPDGQDELVLKLPRVLSDVLEGEDSFAEVHDDFTDALGLDAPTLAEEEEEE